MVADDPFHEPDDRPTRSSRARERAVSVGLTVSVDMPAPSSSASGTSSGDGGGGGSGASASVPVRPPLGGRSPSRGILQPSSRPGSRMGSASNTPADSDTSGGGTPASASAAAAARRDASPRPSPSVRVLVDEGVRVRLREERMERREASPTRRASRHAHFDLKALPGSVALPQGAVGSAAGLPDADGGDVGVVGPAGALTPPVAVTLTPPVAVTVTPPAASAPQSASARTTGTGLWRTYTPDERDLAHVNSALELFSQSERGDREPASDSPGMKRTTSGLSLDSLGKSSGEDYDYRLDKDPVVDEEEYEEREREREREREKANEEGAVDHETERHRLHAILDSGAAAHVQGGYVQLGETDGLPALPNEDTAREDLRAATDLVRSHTGGRHWGSLRRRVRSGSVQGHADKATGSGEKPTASTTATDVEKQLLSPDNSGANAPLNAPPGVSGNSVLSSLLALYNSQQSMDSTTTTAVTSAVTTPASSRPPSPSASDEPPSTPRRHFWQRRAPGVRDEQAGGDTSRNSGDSASFTEKKRSKSQTSIADRDEPDRGFLAAVARQVEEFRHDRPKAARSGAGVFGALIGSTGGMAAAAVPAASTLIPAAKRPGYHLTRYSLVEEPPSPRFKPPSRPSSTANISGLRSRPSSTSALNGLWDAAQTEGSQSRPTSLYSTYEGTGTGATNDTLREAKISDNLLMMKSKAKRSSAAINPLNLKAVKSAETWLGKSFDDLSRVSEDDRRRKEAAAEKRRKKKAREARKKHEVFIIRHVAAIITRQQFILKLARSLMMFGSPTHRIETQIQATAKVLDINCQVVYLPNTMLISFSDERMRTSETKFLKQTSQLDLGKLLATHNLYWEVVHDRMSVDDANKELDYLMTAKPLYQWWKMVVIGAFCSALIVIPSYYGSFLDALMAAPLGMILIVVQTFAARNDLFSGVFEIAIATFISFLAAALGDTRYFCYTALVSGGIVMILPGYIVLTGALELASRNITTGAVRMGYSVIYSLFLGFGISMGAEIYMKIANKSEITNATDYTCSATHYSGAPWYMQTPSGYWYYLCVPAFAFFLSLANQQPIFRKEMPIMVAFACAGWVTNHFAGQAFSGRSDIVSAIGSFCVGLIGNLYGRFFSNGASFPVMVTGILMQLPSGLKEGGLFNFAADTKEGTFSQYSSGFSVAAQLVSVAIGLTVGLFCAAVITNPLGGSRRRGGGIFTF